MLRGALAALVLALAVPFAGASGWFIDERAYTYAPSLDVGPGGACGDANVFCRALDGTGEWVLLGARDSTQVGPAPHLALWVELTGAHDFRSGIACNEVELPTDGATHALVKLLPAGTWRCDWCPVGGGGEVGRAERSCGAILPVSAQPTTGRVYFSGA